MGLAYGLHASGTGGRCHDMDGPWHCWGVGAAVWAPFVVLAALDTKSSRAICRGFASTKEP